jgi:DNA polymerase III delta prime subunit
MELDGDKCGADAVRGLEQSGGFLSTRPWGKAKAIVVNESHGMTPKAVQAWLTLLERLPKWAVVVFTSTESPDVFGSFAGPFSRRCINISLSNQGLAGPFAARLVEVAKAEGYELAHNAAVRILQAHQNNLGRAIEELEGILAERAGQAA